MTATVVVASGQVPAPVTVYVYVPPAFDVGSKVPLSPPPSADGPVQAPPASGVPPSSSNRSEDASVSQTINVPGVPAIGAILSVTVTSEVASGQPAAETVYVYVPADIVAGSNVPLSPPPSAEGPVHVPPASGVPPRKSNRSADASAVQNVAVPFVPASGAGFTVTVIWDVEEQTPEPTVNS